MEYFGLTDSREEDGFYAGFIGAAFMWGRLFSAYSWGRVADDPRYGRKTVISVGLATMVATSLMFCLAGNFWVAVLARFIAGLFNGVSSTAKAVCSELVEKNQQAAAMVIISASWYPFCEHHIQP